MNQASWSRILQRAGDEFPSEGGAAIIDFQDRIASSRKARGQKDGAGNHHAGELEADLRRALDRAGHKSREQSLPTARGRVAAPVPARLANPRMNLNSAPVPPSVAQSSQKPKGNGFSNVLAISISVAVIAFAVHQIGVEWGKVQDGQASSGAAQAPRAEPPLTTAAIGSGSEKPQTPESRASERNAIRLDLRLSLAPEAASDRGPGAGVGSQAAASAPAQASLSAPASEAGSDPFGESEQSMLRRGRDLIERGHLSGARLIFEHLAEQQSALGAFALAQTYDRRFLGEMSITEDAADDALAAKWYQRAAELGNASAALR